MPTEMSPCLFYCACVLLTFVRTLHASAIPLPSIEEIGAPRGPPVVTIGVQGSSRNSEPQPPSIDDLDLRAPAPPDDVGPQPPAAPDPFLLAAFEKDPGSFQAVLSQWQLQNKGVHENVRDKRRVPQRNVPTYDQFVTAALVIGLGLQRSAFTMFPPSDLYLQKLNVSLPILALQDKHCASSIVRAHTVPGRIALNDGMQEMAFSLAGQPIFFDSKQANGANIVRRNVEADYGVVHIIDGLIDDDRLMDACRTRRPLLSLSIDRRQEPGSANGLNNRRISARRVNQDDFLFDASIGANDINHGDQVAAATAAVVVVPALDEENIPIELLANIDNFAHAVKLTWETEDNVIAVLQGLGASTFLALLERSHLMDTISAQGPWTVFAPDNDAWQSLPKDAFDHIMHDPVLLDQILSYHIIAANVTRRDMANDRKLVSLHEANPVHVNFYSDGWASWYTASGSQIIDLDEVASNGVVHVVRSVLLPPLGDLYSTVKWTPALQTAFYMLDSANDPVFTNSSAQITAFLPEDSPALDAITRGQSPAVLAGMIRKHVARGAWFLSGLIDGDRLLTIGDDILTVTHEGDCVAVNGACIVVRDITLTNGVLHVVDKSAL